jgi:hypothetical protein
MGTSESKTYTRRQSVSAFLPAPKTDVAGEERTLPSHGHGLAYMQGAFIVPNPRSPAVALQLSRVGGLGGSGWRSHMEDAHVLEPELPGLPGWSFYAVLDGHAGREVALHSEANLAKTVLQEILPVCESLTGLEEAMHRAFLRHDRALERDFKVVKDRSGATCTSVLLTPTHFVFANVGDSRTLLCRAGRVAFETQDHKPNLPDERQRIRDAGGFVLNARVDGGLGMCPTVFGLPARFPTPSHPGAVWLFACGSGPPLLRSNRRLCVCSHFARLWGL